MRSPGHRSRRARSPDEKKRHCEPGLPQKEHRRREDVDREEIRDPCKDARSRSHNQARAHHPPPVLRGEEAYRGHVESQPREQHHQAEMSAVARPTCSTVYSRAAIIQKKNPQPALKTLVNAMKSEFLYSGSLSIPAACLQAKALISSMQICLRFISQSQFTKLYHVAKNSFPRKIRPDPPLPCCQPQRSALPRISSPPVGLFFNRKLVCDKKYINTILH